MLDESCHTLPDVAPAAGTADGINIKLTKSGGIREAVRMIHAARALGLRVMLGCMNESSLGIAGAAQISPLVDVVDLDGHLLNANDTHTGLGFADGCVAPRRRAGPWRRPAGAVAVKRYVILAEGAFDEEAKTATGVMRYAQSPTVAVIDSTRAGTVAGDHVPGLVSDVPVVSDAGRRAPARADDAPRRGRPGGREAARRRTGRRSSTRSRTASTSRAACTTSWATTPSSPRPLTSPAASSATCAGCRTA